MKPPIGKRHGDKRLKAVQCRFVGISRRIGWRNLRKDRQDKGAIPEEETSGEFFHNATSYCSARPAHATPTLPALPSQRGSRTSRVRRRPAVWMQNRCIRSAPRSNSAATLAGKETGVYPLRRRLF